MKFYVLSRIPKDQKLVNEINYAANRLFNKISKLDINLLDISDYSKGYLRNILKDLVKSLRLYSYILMWSIHKTNTPLNKFVFVDYGGGLGLLSLLAREVGIGTIIYDDIYEVSCKDSKTIAELLKLKANYYVHGDIDDIINFLNEEGMDCNAIASHDVIEHIYDIDSFFRKLQLLSKGSLRVIMASGANKFNPLIRRMIIKKQIEAEYEDREKISGHKERDCLKSYLKARKEIINEYLKESNIKLTESEIDRLTESTRGCIIEDIKECVDDYIKTREISIMQDNSSNTCDPYTGNWVEHLMNPDSLASILNELGFKSVVLCGYYFESRGFIKKLLGKILNIVIYLTGKHGIRLAPFYTIYGTR